MAASSSSSTRILGARLEQLTVARRWSSAKEGQVSPTKNSSICREILGTMGSMRLINSGPKKSTSASASFRQYSISSEV